ncbi:MAG: choline dehydrogenase [Sphingobium sp.]|nr:choline dehydrogenase [Sphingobium sp.]
MKKSVYDVIVIGAGSAGCAVAGRLACEPGLRVLLIEAGGRSSSPLIKAPVAWPLAAITPQYGWGLETEPDAALAGRRLDQPRGRVMGGTSSINGMMVSRGHPADYDGWAAMGLDGWGWRDVLPYFRRGERNWRGTGQYHGGDGPLNVIPNPTNPSIFDAMISAGHSLGYEYNPDFNGAEQEGFGMPDFAQRSGRRESGATAYLRDHAVLKNLTVKQGNVYRVLIEKGRAIGVEMAAKGGVTSIHAPQIILSAGVFGSPQLLQLSGVGPADFLLGHGIAPVVNLPGVGQNLQDHPMVVAGYAAAKPLGFEQALRLDRLAKSSLQWLMGKGGLLSDAPLCVQGYVRAMEASDRPDTQFQISCGSLMSRPWLPGWRRPSPDMFGVAALHLRPEGRGRVMLRSANPMERPLIHLSLLSTEYDRQMARAMFRFIRRFFATPAMQPFVASELMPGPSVTTDDDVDAFLANTILSGAHQVGTCAMGVDPAHAVVDARLKVHGVEGLSVADASVMPHIISGNTSVPAMMIGERCADFILGRSFPAGKETVSSITPPDRVKEGVSKH